MAFISLHSRWVVFTSIAVGLRIKPPDVRVQMLQTKFEVKTAKHNSSIEQSYVGFVQHLLINHIYSLHIIWGQTSWNNEREYHIRVYMSSIQHRNLTPCRIVTDLFELTWTRLDNQGSIKIVLKSTKLNNPLCSILWHEFSYVGQMRDTLVCNSSLSHHGTNLL